MDEGLLAGKKVLVSCRCMGSSSFSSSIMQGRAMSGCVAAMGVHMIQSV